MALLPKFLGWVVLGTCMRLRSLAWSSAINYAVHKRSIYFSTRFTSRNDLKPDKLQNHSNEGKGKENKKWRGEGKEEKRKKQWLHS